MNRPQHPLLAALWSVAIPGFGQLYNKQYFKGFFFIILEFIINLNAHLNMAIYYSWLMDIENAHKVINYEWLLFYPCFYIFAIFDAYHESCMINQCISPKYTGVPFVLTWLLGTVGVILSSKDSPLLFLSRIGPVFFGTGTIILVLGGGLWIVNRINERITRGQF